MSNSRAVPMEILALGLCRTGTQFMKKIFNIHLALADGLQLLGYGPIYHMREVHKNGHVEYWLPMLEFKFEGKGRAFGREDFDEFLGAYSGVSDIPPAIFAEELMDAYPEAKIILTVRDENKWFESMKATLWHAKNSEFGQKMSRYLWGEDKDENAKSIFREHNENVKRWAEKRGREVLVYEVKEGWGPLCEFLGKSVPEGKDFPRKDDWAAYKKEHGTQQC